MTRKERLQWCKDRALEYLPARPSDAIASMMSDMEQSQETKGHGGIQLGAMLLLSGHLNSVEAVRKWINGFN